MDSNQHPNNRTSISLRQDEDDENDLLKLWQTVWQRKWSIIAFVLVVVMVTILVVFTITPTYRAAATLVIEEKTPKVVSIEQIYDMGGNGSEFLQTQFELLKSRALVERVVKELKLTTHPEFDPRQRPEPLIDVKGLLANFDFNKIVPVTLPGDLEVQAELSEAKIFDQVTANLASRISIQPQGKSQLVKVQVDMADARTAALAANALAKGFIEGQLEANMDMSLTATNWLNDRLSELRVKLKTAEDRLQAFREAENLVDVNGVSTVSAAELSKTGDRMIDARRERAEAESQYRQVQALRSAGWERLASVPAVLGHPLIQQFKAEEARASAKVQELSRRYGPRHPAMVAAQSDLTAATASLRAQVEQVVAGIERTYQLAVANENSLEASFNSNRDKIQDISRKEFELRELQREVDSNRALYDTFMTRLKETVATSNMDSATARIVDLAIVPTTPVAPKKTLIVALAAILAGMVAVGLTLLLDALNNTFKSSEDIESRLNLPVFGILPLLKKVERSVLAHMFANNTNPGFSEAVRTIRTGVSLSSVEDPHKVIVVTSAIPGEGKSTVSCNLAYAFSRMEKVLLIDADLRRPTLSKNFGFPVGSPGLANLIAGNATLTECIKHVDGVDMICAGTVPPNPLELISSTHFSKLLEALKAHYAHIIIDSPPTQAVSDAVVLANSADSVLYVVKSATTPIPVVEKGIGQLLQNNLLVCGVVLNQVDLKKAKKYGYLYGYQYDHYGYSKPEPA
ncbi:polysaccharide biosynthesis tyrosine autokinase [Pseudomonas asiatica]|uniref:GumC family protein n=1 Tax=Pseudomonas asiatica TaxID=2219225 RepID=UPI002E7C32A4|nr:polysaccharide biosynthesis tyrosine autokinase [Pseudomonas asiatica]MEE1917687.1 polysaccharide biosynthesis tyrosine autokinase [Pseudomonas asiatica]